MFGKGEEEGIKEKIEKKFMGASLLIFYFGFLHYSPSGLKQSKEETLMLSLPVVPFPVWQTYTR